MINEAVNLIRGFHIGAGQTVLDKPTLLSPNSVDRRVRWIESELSELTNAKTLVEQVDAVTDCLYYLLGCYVEMGVIPDPVFCIVHQANMRKLIECKTDSDGRVQKPKGWTHPDKEIEQEIEKQLAVANSMKDQVIS